MARFLYNIIVNIKTQRTMANKNEIAPIHHCNVCGRTMYWKDFIWINSNFGVCEDCHNKIPQDINEEIQEENYNEKVAKFLNEIGASY